MVSAAALGSSAKHFSKSAETGSSVASTMALACARASSRVTRPSRLPSVPACAPLEVASAWKPRPARMRADPASQAFAMTKQRPCSCRSCAALPDRRGVHQAALVPQAVQAALEAERLQVGVEALAVVADLLDDVERPAGCRGRASCRCRRSRRRSAGSPGWCWSAARRYSSVGGPSSSASSMAKIDHFTTSNQRSSPWRTAGPSGSLEMISGRITWSSGFGARERASRRGRSGRWCRRRSGRRSRRSAPRPASRSPPA